MLFLPISDIIELRPVEPTRQCHISACNCPVAFDFADSVLTMTRRTFQRRSRMTLSRQGTVSERWECASESFFSELTIQANINLLCTLFSFRAAGRLWSVVMAASKHTEL